MDSSPSTSGPSPREVENLGSLFAGFVATTLLYGLTFFQTYAYYAKYPRDNNRIRYLVMSLSILDTAISALVSAVVYHYLIDMFNVSVESLRAPTTLCVQYALSFLLVFMAQLFFAYRVLEVTHRSRRVSLLAVSLSFISFVFGITSAGQMFRHRQLSDFSLPKMKAVALTNLIFAVLADVVILSAMYYWLRLRHHPKLLIPTKSFERAVVLFVNRGLCFTILQLAHICIFVALPSRQFWIAFQMTGCKFYVNSVLALLNHRKSDHGHGLNEEEPLPPRGIPKGVACAPCAIGIVDREAVCTHHSSCFSQGQETTTTEAMENADSAKSIQGEVVHEYTQVATVSSSEHGELRTDASASV